MTTENRATVGRPRPADIIRSPSLTHIPQPPRPIMSSPARRRTNTVIALWMAAGMAIAALSIALEGS